MCVLLAQYYAMRQLSYNFVVMSTSAPRSSIDIKVIVETHCDTDGDISPAHTLSECDMVSSVCEIGKGIGLDRSLCKLGNI